MDGLGPTKLSTLLYPVSLLSGCWDDQCRNPNANNRDYLVGQLTTQSSTVAAWGLVAISIQKTHTEPFL